jgi:hypothetical protein
MYCSIIASNGHFRKRRLASSSSQQRILWVIASIPGSIWSKVAGVLLYHMVTKSITSRSLSHIFSPVSVLQRRVVTLLFPLTSIYRLGPLVNSDLHSETMNPLRMCRETFTGTEQRTIEKSGHVSLHRAGFESANPDWSKTVHQLDNVATSCMFLWQNVFLLSNYFAI